MGFRNLGIAGTIGLASLVAGCDSNQEKLIVQGKISDGVNGRFVEHVVSGSPDHTTFDLYDNSGKSLGSLRLLDEGYVVLDGRKYVFRGGEVLATDFVKSVPASKEEYNADKQ